MFIIKMKSFQRNIENIKASFMQRTEGGKDAFSIIIMSHHHGSPHGEISKQWRALLNYIKQIKQVSMKVFSAQLLMREQFTDYKGVIVKLAVRRHEYLTSFKEYQFTLTKMSLDELVQTNNVLETNQLKLGLDMLKVQSLEEETQNAAKHQFPFPDDQSPPTSVKELEKEPKTVDLEPFSNGMNFFVFPKPLYPSYKSIPRPAYPMSKGQVKCGDKTDFDFDVDLSNPFLSSILLAQNMITKQQGEESVMIYASNYIPSIGYYSVKARINSITDGQMQIGLVSDPHQDKSFVGNQRQTVKLYLDGTHIMIEGNVLPLQFRQFQECQIIEMCVDVGRKRCRFYRNGRDKHFLEIIIPESMAKAKLFPFIQIAEIGDSFELLL